MYTSYSRIELYRTIFKHLRFQALLVLLTSSTYCQDLADASTWVVESFSMIDLSGKQLHITFMWNTRSGELRSITPDQGHGWNVKQIQPPSSHDSTDHEKPYWIMTEAVGTAMSSVQIKTLLLVNLVSGEVRTIAPDGGHAWQVIKR